MPDPRDIVDIGGLLPASDRGSAEDAANPAAPGRSHLVGAPFLSIWFRCCHVYSRVYRNRERTHYEGRCPKCAAPLRVRIGPGGTTLRTFEAR